MGTQKLEEEFLSLFPGTKCLRMDMDTTKGKQGHEKILAAFRKKEAQVLIGTQMVAKGLDFPDVTFVGAVACDQSLYMGDFRSAEYTFCQLTQVSGRAGRREGEKGRVYIQTYNPEHYAIKYVKEANYEEFYAHEIEIRRAMNYPPFSHVFSVLFTGISEKEVIRALQTLYAIMNYCNKQNKFELLGIAPAIVSKIKDKYRWKILVKSKLEDNLKAFVLYCIKKLKENDKLEGIQINLHLNPVMME